MGVEDASQMGRQLSLYFASHSTGLSLSPMYHVTMRSLRGVWEPVAMGWRRLPRPCGCRTLELGGMPGMGRPCQPRPCARA